MLEQMTSFEINYRKKFQKTVTLAESMKTENNKNVVSSIVCRADSFREVDEVNAHLEELCAEKDMAIITNNNINPKRHLK